MNTKSLRQLSNEALLKELHGLVSEERAIGMQVLTFLKEVKSRLLYLECGYSSLFTFCVEELKYSEAMSYHRINAMEALEEMPEIRPALQSGELSIATLSLVQSTCKAERRRAKKRVTTEKKKVLIEEIKGKSKRQAETVLLNHFPELALEVRPEREKRVDQNHTEIRFNADRELSLKFQRIKELTAHQNPSPSYQELFHLMADIVLDRIDPLKKAEKKTEQKRNVWKRDRANAQELPAVAASEQAQLSSIEVSESSRQQQEKLGALQQNAPSRYIPQHIKVAVWKKAQGRCEFVDPATQKRCNETRRLQIEHRVPFAVAGDHSQNNLELLCTGHNFLRATQWFGKEKINRFIIKK